MLTTIRAVLVLCAFNFTLFGVLDRIQKALEKNDFEKAMDLIEKGYEKEPDNAGIYYLHSQLLFTTTYDKFNPEEARQTIIVAREKYDSATEDLKEELLEESILPHDIDSLGIAIRDYLFHETLSKLTQSTIQDFRVKYPDSIYDDILIFKRDSIVFNRVKIADSKEGYADFIQNYTASIFKTEADSLLDRLRYLDLINTGTLKDYIGFRSKYPLTYRMKDVEKYILKVSTASHDQEVLENFIRTARTDVLRKKAADVLFYLTDRETDDHPMKDSIKYAFELFKRVLFPVMDRDIFGFHNTMGSMQIPYSYDDVQEEIKCISTTDDWLFVRKNAVGQIIQKDGNLLIDDVDDYESVSESVALITKDGQQFLYHKSGFRIMEEPVTSAEAFKNGWLKVERNSKWGLYTLMGFPIAEVRYDDIYQLGSFWVFERGGLLGVYTASKILKEIEENGLALEFKFDDLELVNEDLLIGFRDERECLLDNELNFLIPWGDYEIHPDPAGWYLRSEEGYYLYNNTDDRIIDRKYPYIESNDGWLALKTEDDWMLISRSGQLNPQKGYDSIKLINASAALVFNGENKVLVFGSGKEIQLEDHNIQAFPNRPEFLMISNQGALGLYDQNGESVFDGKYDNLTFLNDTLLKVTVKKKQGIIDTKGEFVLKPIFESLDEKDGLILTLHKGAIGCYDLSNNVLIPADYESRISKVGASYLVKKEGLFGLIDANEEEVLGFDFEDIKHWNDTSYLVKQEGKQNIINGLEEILVENIERTHLFYEQGSESIFRIVKDGKFGMISNENGMILKPEYSEILNIGDEENPLFFADQHLNNAGFHVVSYVNESGELIFSKAYRKEEFDRIICDD